MSSIKVKLDLSKQQLSKLKSANKKNNKSASIRFSNEQIFKESGHEIEISPEQYKKLLSASKSKSKRGCVLSFSASQVQSGGFLPMLLSALAGPLISGISNAIQGKRFFGDGLVPLGNGLIPLGGSRQRGSGKKKK